MLTIKLDWNKGSKEWYANAREMDHGEFQAAWRVLVKRCEIVFDDETGIRFAEYLTDGIPGWDPNNVPLTMILHARVNETGEWDREEEE